MAFIDAYRDRFGDEPIRTVSTEYGMPIAPSTYYAANVKPVSDADRPDAYAANTLLDLWRPIAGPMGSASCGMRPPARACEADPAALDRHPDHVQRNWNSPTGADVSRWSTEDLEAVALALINRPGKVLGWKTPAEVFEEQVRSLEQPGVASTA